MGSLPSRLALVEDDAVFALWIEESLKQHGIGVSVFPSGIALLSDPNAFQFPFYLVDMGLPDMDGVAVIKVLAARTKAGLVVVSAAHSPSDFDEAVRAGADGYLMKPADAAHLLATIRAVHRRAKGLPPSPRSTGRWVVHCKQNQIVAPNGARVTVSAAQTRLLECFAEAKGSEVPWQVLGNALGPSPGADAKGALRAAMYRLRRQVESGSGCDLPMKAVPQVGYVFRAPLACHDE